ncbi:MAG: DUF5103 domain-containing protein [Bacteroides sp.]|nr:DUF5103 domain-containing protein [Roseburia sp.]MCM1346619.1 DUF5103 domain-containing protein [Bacteroides sp.]MCM1421173.1 DUF5103 domain-containing protein [Bacteroides sp.]
MWKNPITYIFFTCVATGQIAAQENAVFADNLKSIQVEVNGEWGSPPVMLLGGGNFVEVSFDDLQHSYVRYTYRIVHCNADWTPSDLLESEYLNGFNGNRIEEYEQSMNTAMEYNHYSVCIPNEDIKLLVSGNYRMDIYEDGEDEPVARACFSVLEPRVGVDIMVSGNTDIDTNKSHQQLSFHINYQGYQANNPQEEFKPVVCQNRRWDNSVSGVRPTYMRMDQLIYSHNRQLIFNAGNEYRRFEILDEHVPTMRVDRMVYSDPYYHAELFVDEPRRNYVYDEDQDGRYWVRNNDNEMNDTESDYFLTHFRLEMPQMAGGEVYLNGELTNNRLSEQYKMEYDLMEHAYKAVVPLKQGSYNYQYLFVPDGSRMGQTAYTEGDFYQTENEYYVYVYHRAFGTKYDKLVGFGSLKFSN